MKIEGERRSVEAAILSVVGAVLVGLLGYLGGWRASRAQRSLEFEKWLRSRRDVAAQDARLAGAEVITRVAEIAHSVMWFTYTASRLAEAGRTPTRPTEVSVEFQAESHRLIAAAVGAQYRLAAYDVGLYRHVTPIVSEAIDLIESANRASDAGDDAAMHESNKQAYEFIKRLPQHVGDLIGPEAAVDLGDQSGSPEVVGP